MTNFQVIFHVFAEFNSIHLRHHHIRYNQIDIFILQDSDTFFPIFCSKHIIITFQQLRHQLQQLLVILHHQDRISIIAARVSNCIIFLQLLITNSLLYRYNSFIVNLFLSIIRTVNGESHNKLRTLPLFTLYRNSTFMQFY